MILPDLRDYQALRAAFRWAIPERYNIAVDICDRWAAAEPERPAIIEVTGDWQVRPVSFGLLREQSNRLANALRARGVAAGDRIAILLPQGRAVLVAHLAAYKLGAIAVPLAALFGVDALAYRLADSGAKVLITDAAGLAKAGQIVEPLPDLALLISTDGRGCRRRGLGGPAGAGEPRFRARRHRPGRSGADDLHLRHHRQSEGRAARPPRPARPSAGRADAARIPAAAGRHRLDAGRLGLGRRPAQHAAAGAAFRRAGGGPAGDALRAGRGVPPDGRSRHPQCLRPADRAQDAAQRREPAGALRPGPAQRRGRWRDLGRRDAGLGARGARPDHQRSLWPDRVQPRARLLRRDRRQPAGLHRQGGAGP